MTRIMNSDRAVHIGCMFIGADGLVGHHQATTEQLFLVVQGEGWVRSGEAEEVFIQAGHAASWEPGEWHRSRSDTGMTVIVFEGEGLTHDLKEVL